MTLIFRRDPIWIKSLSITDPSAIILLSGDAKQVAVPACLLIAVSPLVRSIMSELLPPAFSPCILSLPAATGKVLQAVVDVLGSGTAASDDVDEIEEVKQVFGLLGVDASLVCCQLENIDVQNVFKQEILDNSTEGPEVCLSEETIKVEIAVKLEEVQKEDTCDAEALSEISNKYNGVESS